MPRDKIVHCAVFRVRFSIFVNEFYANSNFKSRSACADTQSNLGFACSPEVSGYDFFLIFFPSAG